MCNVVKPLGENPYQGCGVGGFGGGMKKGERPSGRTVTCVGRISPDFYLCWFPAQRLVVVLSYLSTDWPFPPPTEVPPVLDLPLPLPVQQSGVFFTLIDNTVFQ